MRRILLLALSAITLPIFLPQAARAQVVEVAPGGVIIHRHHHHHYWERERYWREERRWRERHRWDHYHHYHDWD